MKLTLLQSYLLLCQICYRNFSRLFSLLHSCYLNGSVIILFPSYRVLHLFAFGHTAIPQLLRMKLSAKYRVCWTLE